MSPEHSVLAPNGRLFIRTRNLSLDPEELVYEHLVHKGVELKLVRGEELFWFARDFSPPEHDFCPPLGILFNFFSLYR